MTIAARFIIFDLTFFGTYFFLAEVHI